MMVLKREQFDTQEEMEKASGDLATLNAVLSARRSAYAKDKKARLNEFYFLNGRYFTDCFGQVQTVSIRVGNTQRSFSPTDLIYDLPKVMDELEFRAQIRRFFADWLETRSSHCDIPTERVKCGECGETWNINNCHDAVSIQDDKIFPLDNYIGKTIKEVRADYNKRDDAVYHMRDGIRHDRFIDLRPKPGYSSLKMNERGWAGKEEGITDDYVIQEGDEARFVVWKYYHKSCNNERLGWLAYQFFKEIFSSAGFEQFDLLQIPNQYGSFSYRGPWFEVQTEIGTITIGWRKRVINIEWPTIGQDLLPLFKDEDVTKSECNIHAWTEEKAIEYLSKIHDNVSQAVR